MQIAFGNGPNKIVLDQKRRQYDNRAVGAAFVIIPPTACLERCHVGAEAEGLREIT